MSFRSLRLRLMLAASLAIVLAISVSGAVLVRLFTEHVEARELAELRTHLNQIVAALEIDENRQLRLSNQPADPRFERPHGGLYWQIDLADGKKLRSRSLWDTELTLPPDDVKPGIVHRHFIDGPAGSTLLAIEGVLTVGPPRLPIDFRLVVACDRREVEAAVADFWHVLLLSLGVLGIALITAMLLQVHIGLSPLRKLRMALRGVHSGSADRVAGKFPFEVAPLIEDLNALLERERREQQRAKERAADLAHGFKTPLAILAAVTRDLRRGGLDKPAAEVEAQIEIMGCHVKRELARARTLGSITVGRRSILVRPIVEQILSALTRIGGERAISWTIAIAADVVFQGDEGDLLELVGNLSENAAKWAGSKVGIRAVNNGKSLVLEIDDDGPGIPEGDQAASLVRGLRLDESTAGSGLGLSIVTKIVEAYGGSIALDRAPSGGLGVKVVLPG